MPWWKNVTDGSFKANFSRGGSRAFPEARDRAVGYRGAGVLNILPYDLLFDGESFKVCEVNSSPGFKGIESCCDVSIPDVIFDFIQIRLGLYS